MVDTLTPNLVYFGSKKAMDEGWDLATDWLPFVLAIENGPGSEDACPGSLSAGCLAGTDVRWAVTSDSGSASEDTGGLRLSLYPISPRLVGNGSACGRAVVDP